MIQKKLFGITIASIMILGGFSFSSSFLPEADAAIFLKIDGIEGESTADRHQDSIEVSTFSFGVEREMQEQGTSAGATRQQSGTPHFTDIAITKMVDKTSPKLFLATASGERINQVVIDVTLDTGDKATYLQYRLTNVTVSSYNVSGASETSERPAESISLNFERIEIIFTEINHQTGQKGGDVIAQWDKSRNEGG